MEKSERFEKLAFIALYFNKDFKDIYIGDILYYIDQNLYWNKSVFGKARDMVGLEKGIMNIFYLFVGKQNKNIESLGDGEIQIIYSLIKQNENITI